MQRFGCPRGRRPRSPARARSREDLTDTVGDINAVNSPGELTIDGFFTQLDEGNITLEVGKELSSRELLHDALSVSLTVELAGTLEVVLDLLTAGLDPNFDPSVEGVSFTFLTGFADSRDVQ